MSQENVEVPRLLFEAFDRGDRAAFARLLAPDIEWHMLAGPLLGPGVARGGEAMLKFL
jgi:ketosteroid isomerase-like protein